MSSIQEFHQIRDLQSLTVFFVVFLSNLKMSMESAKEKTNNIIDSMLF